MNSKLGDLLNLVNQMVLSIENGIDYNNEPKNGKFHEYVKQAKNLLFENNWHDYCNNWNDARQKLPNRKIVNGKESNISGLKYLHFQGSIGTGFYDFEKGYWVGLVKHPDHWKETVLPE